MSKKFVKANGFQDPDEPMKFVLSTADVDRAGDIVEQDWDLKEFRKNPIALYQHDSENPIGTWENAKVEDIGLTAYLNLAAQGTSALIDTVRSLVAQKILKAVSVGFTVADYEPIEGTNGLRLKRPALHEGSLVSVPMNPNALEIARSCHLSDSEIQKFFVRPKVEIDRLQAPRNRLKFLQLSARKHV